MSSQSFGPLDLTTESEQDWWVKAIDDTRGMVMDDVNMLDVIDVYQNDEFLFEAIWKRSKPMLAPRRFPTATSTEILEGSRLGPRARSARAVDSRGAPTRSLLSPPVLGPGRETPGLTKEETEPQILTNNELWRTLNHSVGVFCFPFSSSLRFLARPWSYTRFTDYYIHRTSFWI